MKKLKVGIFGIGRGGMFINSILMNNADLVAVCDGDESKLADVKQLYGDDLCTYRDFDEFIDHPGLDVVLLCNFFHEHARYAIRALEKNIHVISECTSNATMADGVALVRAAEKSSAKYMLAENYPYMNFNQEMYRVYREGTLGRVLYAEGEYNHPIPIAGEVEETCGLRPFKTHWRNFTPRTYYVTHSLAPLMYITGSTPVRVTAMPVYYPEMGDNMFGPDVKDRAAIITCLNDDNSVFRVTGCAGFGAHNTSYRLCCDKGQIENLRGMGDKVMLRYSEGFVPEGMEEKNLYSPEWHYDEKELIESAGHGGGDFLIIRECLNCIREDRHPVFDVYFATTMASVAILGHRSLLELGNPYDIPDFRCEDDRKKYENDHATPFYGSDGSEPTIPCSSH